MAKVTEKDVEQIALLARLDLTETEKKKYQAELSGILGYVDMLAEVDTENIEPTAQVTGMTNVLRKDLKVPSDLDRDEILSNTPDKKDGYIKVKSVLE